MTKTRHIIFTVQQCCCLLEVLLKYNVTTYMQLQSVIASLCRLS